MASLITIKRFKAVSLPSLPASRLLGFLTRNAPYFFQELKEILEDGGGLLHASPLENNMFEWHFTIRGPKDTDFDGGIYHGRLVFPSDYPMKPPSVFFLTPNGRFEIKTPICISLSDFHPEAWRSALGIRSILESLITFFPTPGEGAVGSLDCPSDYRRQLAQESTQFVCPICGRVSELLDSLPVVSESPASSPPAIPSPSTSPAVSPEEESPPPPSIETETPLSAPSEELPATPGGSSPEESPQGLFRLLDLSSTVFIWAFVFLILSLLLKKWQL